MLWGCWLNCLGVTRFTIPTSPDPVVNFQTELHSPYRTGFKSSLTPLTLQLYTVFSLSGLELTTVVSETNVSTTIGSNPSKI
jgi:hypothetical protein